MFLRLTVRALRTAGVAVARRARWRSLLGIFVLLGAGVTGWAARGDGQEAVLTWIAEGVTRASADSIGAAAQAEARLAEARQQQDRAGEIGALIVLAQARGRQNDSQAAHTHSAAALALAEGFGSLPLLIEAQVMRAMSYYGADQSAAAIALFLQSLDLAERVRPAKRQPILLGLARCYRDLRDYDRALEFAVRALHEAERGADETRIDASAYVLGEIYFSRGELALAREHFARSLALRRRHGIPSERGDSEVALARIDLREGRLAEALAVLDRVELERRTLRGRWKHTHTLIARSEVLAAMGRLDEALADAQRARGFADAIGTPGLLADVYGRLAAVHEARGEAAEALAAMRRYFTAEMEARGNAATQQAAESRARIEAERKDAQLARLADENELHRLTARAAAAELARSRLERWAYLGTAAAIVVVLVILLVGQRTRRRLERQVHAETHAAKEAAERADRLKSRLLVIASHDLKAPLRTILRHGERLAEEPDDATAAAQAGVALQRTGLRMFELVRDLIDVGALEENRLVLRFAPVDLAALAADVVGEYRARAAEKNQELTFEVAAVPTPSVRGDGARLRQVIENLVDNAVKYTPLGRAVRVSVAGEGSRVRLAVTDEGPGLSADDLVRAFQPFERLSAQPTDGEASTGLGLHLAHRLVRLHHGELTVETRPGSGSTFAFSLPVVTAADAAVAPAPTTRLPSDHPV